MFGHPVGDMMMRAAAERLAAEADGAFVARIGGDEFMILMPDDVCREEVLALGERLVEAIGNELEVDDYLSHVGFSVGIALYPDDGVDAATLLANADSALYRAKREGRGRVRFFESEMDQELRDRRLLQHDLRQARGAEPASRLLPAAGADERRGHRLRGAAALEPPDAGLRAARPVHSARRRERADHPDRRMGLARGVPRGGVLAAAVAGGGQSVAGPVPGRRPRTARSTRSCWRPGSRRRGSRSRSPRAC